MTYDNTNYNLNTMTNTELETLNNEMSKRYNVVAAHLRAGDKSLKAECKDLSFWLNEIDELLEHRQAR